jgi:hypothetical protein
VRQFQRVFLQNVLADNGAALTLQVDPMRAIKFRNGVYPVCLVVGGPAEIFRALQDKLGAFGIAALHHWEYKRPGERQSEIPTDVDFVMIMKNAIDHGLSDGTKHKADLAGVRCIRTNHKWSTCAGALRAAGLSALPALPVEAWRKIGLPARTAQRRVARVISERESEAERAAPAAFSGEHERLAAALAPIGVDAEDVALDYVNDRHDTTPPESDPSILGWLTPFENVVCTSVRCVRGRNETSDWRPLREGDLKAGYDECVECGAIVVTGRESIAEPPPSEPAPPPLAPPPEPAQAPELQAPEPPPLAPRAPELPPRPPSNLPIALPSLAPERAPYVRPLVSRAAALPTIPSEARARPIVPPDDQAVHSLAYAVALASLHLPPGIKALIEVQRGSMHVVWEEKE